MNPEVLQAALQAIHDEAVKLLEFEMSEEALKIVDEIIAIARYERDIRPEFR